ncbi:hypothetical protein [Micromonospora sp. 067-2]|uniref:hypothetical protein n=1 Tax=Micromonospora sp. 067-2 TaxID=2789270 RepID=UPI00397E2DD9
MRRLKLPTLVAVAALGLTAVAGCDSTGGPTASAPTPVAPASSSAATPTATPSAAATTGAASTSGAGCTSNGVAIPAGSRKATVADLDGDGRSETLFLTPDAMFGVRTASGATSSVRYDTADPAEPGGEAFRNSDGSAVILLGGGRQWKLFALVDCKVVATRNAQGEQYAFDKSFATPGTGVGCVRNAKGETLVGLRAAKMGMSTDQYEIEQTTIVLAGHGTSARNGQVTATESGLTQRAAWDKAQGTPCSPDFSLGS